MPNETNEINLHGSVSNEFTTDHVKLKGDIQIRILIIKIVGAALLILTSGIVYLEVKGSASVASEYSHEVLPIISGALFGLIGFIVGQKAGPKD